MKEHPFPDSFCEFIKKLVHRISGEDLVYNRHQESTWDTFSRRKFGAIIKDIVAEEFGPDYKGFVYVEGEHFGLKTKLERLGRYKTLFNSPVYPDIAILDKIMLAIELDHLGENKNKAGAKLRTVLAKSSFNTLCETWDSCLVLFFIEQPRNFEVTGDTEKELLNYYESKFATKILIFNLNEVSKKYELKVASQKSSDDKLVEAL